MVARKRDRRAKRSIKESQGAPESDQNLPQPLITVEEELSVRSSALPQEPAGETGQTERQDVTPDTSTPEASQVIDTIFSAKTEQVGQDSHSSQKKPLARILLLIAVFITGALIGSLTMYFIILKPSGGKLVLGKKPTPTATPTQALTPTEAPIDLNKYTIAVLNGTKIKGGAAKLKTSLEAEGFKVASVGNATSSAFTETVIRAKNNTEKPYLEKLKLFLSKSYILKETENLEDSQKTDIVIIIGSKLSL